MKVHEHVYVQGVRPQVLAAQTTVRFKLDSTPDEHTLLALKMNAGINTEVDGPQLQGKSAKAELMQAAYRRALRRSALQRRAVAARSAGALTLHPGSPSAILREQKAPPRGGRKGPSLGRTGPLHLHPARAR